MTTQKDVRTPDENATEAAGEVRTIPETDEQFDWMEMPFVEGNGLGMSASQWLPVEIGNTEDRRHWTAECGIGQIYALEMIGHLRSHKHASVERLCHVIEAMVKRGAWGGVELGFVLGLERYLAS